MTKVAINAGRSIAMRLCSPAGNGQAGLALTHATPALGGHRPPLQGRPQQTQP